MLVTGNELGYRARVRELERQGMTTSDAQGVADAEYSRPVITVEFETPGAAKGETRYALMRGTYPKTQWWTGSAWRETSSKPGRIAWYATREAAEKISDACIPLAVSP